MDGLGSSWQTVISLLALFGGPIVAFISYLAARRKIGAEVHLVEAKTLRERNAVRRELENDLGQLSEALREERDGRREDRDKFAKRIAELEFTYQQTIAALQEKLQTCVDALTEHKIKIDGIEDWPEIQ
jgi:flagellar motility protein MotE (MotC chaperone)